MTDKNINWSRFIKWISCQLETEDEKHHNTAPLWKEEVAKLCCIAPLVETEKEARIALLGVCWTEQPDFTSKVEQYFEYSKKN